MTVNPHLDTLTLDMAMKGPIIEENNMTHNLTYLGVGNQYQTAPPPSKGRVEWKSDLFFMSNIKSFDGYVWSTDIHKKLKKNWNRIKTLIFDPGMNFLQLKLSHYRWTQHNCKLLVQM